MDTKKKHTRTTLALIGSTILTLAFLALAGAASAATAATASFVAANTVSQGNWQGTYGGDGYSLANGPQSVPAYASFAVENSSNWTWNGSTTDPRALQCPGCADRLAAAWYSFSTFTLDINLTDGNTHQIAAYAVDWDNYMGGRSETVEVVDANSNAVLDTRSLSGFSNGIYLVWNISGHVHINVTNNNAGNAVISSVFFGSSTVSTVGASAGAAASFTGLDTSTQGNWHGAYGAGGYAIANDSQSVPAYATFAVQSQSNWTWATGTSDPRALACGSCTGRIASAWYTFSTFNFDLNLTDGNTHQIALYAVDWDSYMGGRSETVQVVDANSNTVLDTRSVSGFSNGVYLVWNISGHVHINVTNNNASNAVISGLFFGSGTAVNTQGATANFAGLDTSTQGNWHGTYGAGGYAIANDSQSVPAYATFAVQSQSNWTWATGTSDPRALACGSCTGRIASAWYTFSTFNFDLNLTDGNTHQIALYAVDWDSYMGGRSETVQVVDANSNTVLDTRCVSGFSNGVYVVWNITGHVHINVTNNDASNAVISGVFFANAGAAAQPPAGQAQIAVSPSTTNFGSVTIGKTSSQTFTISNPGTAALNITQIAISGAGYSVANPALPMTLAPGQTASVTATFAALLSGAVTGTVTISSNAFTGSQSIAMTAVATGTAPAITTQPASQTVAAGQSATFSVANTGTAPLSYQWLKNGAAISGATASSYTQPAASTSDTGSQFSVVVSNSVGSVSSNAALLTVTGTYILNASSASLSFGTVNLSSSSQQSVIFTNAGTANITISNVTMAGAGFNASGLPVGTVLAAGQTVSLAVTFEPAVTGNAAGSVTIASNASNGTKVIALSGTGTSAMHSVALSWSPSTSGVVGYNVYVSTVSGGSYTKLTSSPVAATDYTDASLQTAQTRYYVVTSVDSNNDESAFSNQVAALIP